MSLNLSMTVTGVFPSAEQARRAVEELKDAGINPDHIGVVPAGPEPMARSESGVTIGTGAGAGMLTGAALGGLVGGLPGLVAAAAAGGLLGAFIDLGIPEDAASFYQSEAEAGRPVVLVRTADGADQIAELFRRHGAQEVRSSAASVSDKD